MSDQDLPPGPMILLGFGIIIAIVFLSILLAEDILVGIAIVLLLLLLYLAWRFVRALERIAVALEIYSDVRSEDGSQKDQGEDT